MAERTLTPLHPSSAALMNAGGSVHFLNMSLFPLLGRLCDSSSTFGLEVEAKNNQLHLHQEEFQRRRIKKYVGPGSQSQALLLHP